MSLTPSLLPRSPTFQGAVSGVVAAAGYLLGFAIAALARALVPEAARVPDAVRAVVARLALLVGAGGVVGFMVAGRGWQAEAHRLAGSPVPSIWATLWTVAFSVLLFAGLLLAGCGVRRVTRFVARFLARRLPVVVATVASVVVVATGAGVLFQQVVLRATFFTIDRVSSGVNDAVTENLSPPTSSLRSGGPGSSVAWADLGLRGRRFVAGGPSGRQLSAFSGRPAEEPVRVYVGLNSAPTSLERADLALAELVRTGAFSRAVLAVVSTTGTGWVDPGAANSLEYLWNGDTAIVATQYSYLPSPVAFVLDDDQVESEGAQLFSTIRQYWLRLPVDHRPRLLLYGESLGTNGGAAALGSFPDAGDRVDGALFVGPPNSNHLWREVEDHRDAGSPARRPAFGSGAVVRVGVDRASLTAAAAQPWSQPRVLFLAHASDPVVWWSPDLLLRRPDWLREPRGPGVSSSMGWYPIVTFFQVTADLLAANDVPGAGHRYGASIGAGWAAVAPPDGWTPADTTRLTTLFP
ncbi:alpha/beta hydrolase [Spongisporangium articulatum]|uniref:Alpha/beta hydrolase n=1 Tax=Spongisporangium articulatum TaxID=3362603 RepID=A0ABW8AIP6_9ACTN